MNKKRWVEQLAQRTGRPVTESARVLETFLDVIKERLAARENVALGRFGTFKVLPRRSRTAYNPKLGKEVQVPARWAIRFQATRQLKQEVDHRKRPADPKYLAESGPTVAS